MIAVTPNSILAARRVHFIGLGGIGMSGLAHMLLACGVHVSGSDVKDSDLLSRLRAAGAHVVIGHSAQNVGAAELVVISTAIPPDNPERRAAESGTPVIHRSELLQALMSRHRVIAISGTAGKSTTTAMTARILVETGKNPGVILGAESADLDGNWRVGGEWFVAEADESDGSFLRCVPEVAVITNVECDHLDYFADLEHVMTAFQEFARNVRAGGRVVLGLDCPNARQLQAPANVTVTTYGTTATAEYRVTD